MTDETDPRPTGHSPQKEWFALRDKLGEAAARKHLADRLRRAADHVERTGMPDVFGCGLEDENSLIYTVSATSSHPWPG